MPPLRERRPDIPALARFFADRYAAANGKTIAAISPEAMDLLLNYGWPGNVRELENAIERAVVLSTGDTIEPKQLPPHVRPAVAPTGMPIIPGSTMADIERFAILETLKATNGSTSRAAEMLGISTRTVQYRMREYVAAPKSDVDVVRKREREPDAE